MTEKYSPLEACVDCVGAIANDDYSSLDLLGLDEATSAAARISEAIRWWYSNGYSLVVTGDEPSFSSSPCDVCRSRLSGSRITVEVVQRARKGNTDG